MSAPTPSRRPWALVAGVLVLASPFAAQARSPRAGEPPLGLVAVRNGFGQLLPHRVAIPDAAGLPTSQVIEIRTHADLLHLRPTNPVLPPSAWPAAALLPSALPGNHFVLALFDQPLDVAAILTDEAARAPFGSLTEALRVELVEPSSGARRTLRGRSFVGGRTFGASVPGDPSRLRLETWVADGGGGTLVALDPRALGFPGTQGGFAGAELLVDPRAFVFVPDADGALATHETFPAGCQVQVRLTRKIRARSGAALAAPGLASATVGTDACPPELALRRLGTPHVVPLDGAEEVDPRTDVRLHFSEPIQPLSLGPLAGLQPAGPSPAVQLLFGPDTARVSVPFTARPPSVLDLATYELDPAFDFPGRGPVEPPCPDFATIEVRVNAGPLADLAANHNLRARSSVFRTAMGPGLVNAPVTPDAIYVARSAGLSVVDLNGFGASTGDPTYDLLHPIVEGHSNFPNDPNVFLQGALLIPPLGIGTCSFAGGAEGAFRLTKESNLGDVLASAPTLGPVADMALGHALDLVYNNAVPFGCTSGGGNLCASTGLKLAALIPGGPSTLAPSTEAPGVLPIKIVLGHENLVSFAPHPNPPPLAFPPLCQAPHLLGQEPTSIDVRLAPPVGLGLSNLLVPGPFPLGIPEINLPPQGLLTPEQNTFFLGPSRPQPNPASCSPFAVRQQIGQFLYALDRAAEEVVVLNSNRFLVLARIPVPDPTSLAMSPNLDLLAITSEATDQVLFLDVDPASASFHELVHAAPVGDGPRGIAWESGNEDLLVCCTAADAVYVLSAFTLHVRKVLSEHLRAPLDVALTPRQTTFGFARNVYLGYVLNADGTVAVFESGPSGINGIGFDAIVGELPFVFHAPRAIQPDVTNLNSGFVVAHERPLGTDGQPTGQHGGALTRVGITGGTPGPIPLQPGELPTFRNLEWGVLASVGEGPGGLTGIPVDLAFDDQRNLSALTTFSTVFSAGQPLSVNGKGLVRVIGGGVLSVTNPQFLFVAVPASAEGPGVVDVLLLPDLERVDTDAFDAGIQSIPAAGVTGLMSYFRQ